MNKLIELLQNETAGYDIPQTLEYLTNYFGNTVKFSSSLGQEDQVITSIISENKLPVDVFTLDTGRLFPESYELLHLTQSKFDLNIEVLFPERESVEQLVAKDGINGFYNSVEQRKACCYTRKIEPLKRALKSAQIWVTGLRAAQSENRQSKEKFEYDDNFKLIKYNPLINWTLEEVESYVKTNNIPQNTLHAKGYPSIGCAPCTRPVPTGQGIRAGRWWWEASHKECGLHT